MCDLHPNTLALMKLELKANSLGYKGDFCRDIAYKMGEQGNDYPSIDAILLAENIIKKLESKKGKGTRI